MSVFLVVVAAAAVVVQHDLNLFRSVLQWVMPMRLTSLYIGVPDQCGCGMEGGKISPVSKWRNKWINESTI